MPRRIVALAAHSKFRAALAELLAPVDSQIAVEIVSSIDDVRDAALAVVHLESADDASLIAKLPAATQVIAILPRASLPAFVATMQSSERVAGMLVAEDLDSADLRAMIQRVHEHGVFGLDRLVAGDTIQRVLVASYAEKLSCIAQINALAEAKGVRRKYREAIEHCVDELLMNALYDAPVDDAGRPLREQLPPTKIVLEGDRRVVVQYACDGTRFYIAVRDAFGRLERDTVLRYLDKCLHAEQQIDKPREGGGAGLGLYLIASTSSQLYFRVRPGEATEAVCIFELKVPRQTLEGFGFVRELAPAVTTSSGRPLASLAALTKPRRVRPAVVVLGIAIAVTLALIAIEAHARLRGKRAHATGTSETRGTDRSASRDDMPDAAGRRL